jgi:hypothetical protein
MRLRALAILLILVVGAVATPAEGGHELPIYPSFYPAEIEVTTVDPPAAARLLPKGGIHAYVGAEPAFAAPPPSSVGSVASLGGFVTVSVDPPDCRSLRQALRGIADHPRGIIFHPWPVTPFHPDYLEQADLAAAAMARARASAPAPVTAKLEQVDAAALVGATDPGYDGWLGPPWRKAGWFAAYRLLADALVRTERQRADIELAQLERGGFEAEAERYAAERRLVSLLAGNCRRAVAGYTLRREWYDGDFSSGVENIAYDSLSGLDSHVFIRTVKLKDFPWNGWLRLGVASPPAAAWNPVAGFTDPSGRLIWAALGDPAAFPAPYGGGWTLDRIADVTPSQ